MKIHCVIWSKKIARNKALQVSTKTSLSHSFKPSESSGVVRGNFAYFPAFYFPWSVKLVKFSFWTTKIKYLTRQPGQVKRIHIRGKKNIQRYHWIFFFSTWRVDIMISGVKKIFKDIFEYFFYSWYHYINPSRGIRVDIMSNTQAITLLVDR